MSAINMFLLSPACQATLYRYETICQFLKPDCTTPRNAVPKIMQEFHNQGKTVGPDTIKREISRLRTAYKYYHLEDHERPSKDALNERASSSDEQRRALRPLLSMLENGVTTWGQVKEGVALRRVPQQNPNSQEPPSDDSTGEDGRDTASELIHSANPSLAQIADERRPLTSHSFPLLKALASAGATIMGELGRMAEEATYLHDIRTHNEQLLARQNELEEQNRQLAERIALQEEARKTIQSRLASVENRVQVLTEQVREVAPDQMEKIADLFPEFPIMYKMADDIRDKMRERKAITNTLPANLSWHGDHDGQPVEMLSIVYHPAFKMFFTNTNKEMREAIIEQIHFLFQEGPSHTSFKMQKNIKPTPPQTPGEHLYIRFSIGVRVTCSKEGPELHFYNIIPRGDR